MKLRRLRIDRLPGIDPGFELGPDGLGDGLHVLVGPNAIGKSSLVRAVRALLFDERVEGPVSLRAEFDDAGEIVVVEREGRDVRWLREGRPTPPPELPSAEFASCYTIRLEDLLADDATDAAIAQRIARALAGGYDLAGVREAEPFRLRTTRGTAEKKAYHEATYNFRKVASQHDEVRSNERKLDELRRELGEAKAAVEEIGACETAHELLEARRAARAAMEALQAFSESIAHLDGDAPRKVAALREKRAKRDEERREAEQAESAARRTIESTGLAGRDLDEGAIREWRGRIDALAEIERAAATAELDEHKAQAALDTALAELGASRPAGDVRLTPESVRSVEDRVRELHAAEAGIAALEARISALPDLPSDDVAALRQARGYLFEWLGAASSYARLGSMVIAGATLVALAAVAGAVVAAWKIHVAWLLLLVPAVLGGFLVVRRARPRGVADQASIEGLFGRVGVRRPDAWTVAAVLRCLEEIDRACIAAASRPEREHLARERSRLAAARDEAKAALERVAAEAGFGESALRAGFDRWVRLSADYDRARVANESAVREREHLLGKAAVERDAILEFLASYDAAPESAAPDARVLRDRLDGLEERVRTLRKATGNRDANDHRRSEIEREIDEVDGEIESIFRRAGLESGDDAGLEDLTRKRPEWEKARDRATVAETEARLVAARVHDPALLALVESEDEPALRERLEEADARAGRLDEIRDAIAAIEQEVAAVRRGHDLEEARAARDAAREDLAACLEEEQFAEAGRLLLEEVEREHVEEARPEVLRRAKAWFEGFTHHAWSLVTPRTGAAAALEAVETARGEVRPLSALSSGTRTQLLLAVRLAFLREVERGGRATLPVFLDEALTTTDPERFREIAGSVHEFAGADGRQVFYLTAQPSDIVAWSAPGGSEPRVLDVAALRGRARAVEDPAALAPLPPPSIPEAAGRSAEAYGAALAVPSIDPWAPAEAVHVFHLLRDDLALVARLLRRSVRTAGQLEAWLGSDMGEAALLGDETERRALALRVRAARVFLEAWREGRGCPLDRTALEEGGVTATFLDRITELASELGGDAAALLRALDARNDERAKGFRRETREGLAAYFRGHGHLDDRPRLSLDEVVERVARAIAADTGADPETWATWARGFAAGLPPSLRSDAPPA